MSSFSEKLEALLLSQEQIVTILALVDTEIIGGYEPPPPSGELTMQAWIEQDDHIATKNDLRKEQRARLGDEGASQWKLTTDKQIAAILRRIERMLKHATRLRRETDKEDRENKRRATPVWTKSEEHDQMRDKLDASLQPGGIHVGLHAIWSEDLDCYVLFSD